MKTFIVADDELLVRVGLRSLADWEASGYRLVGEAADGQEALDLIEAHDPDLVVTDIVMPRLDGLELTRRLREARSSAGIVVLSCRNDFDSVREALRLGADDYVFKLTLKSAELIEAFERASAKHPRAAPSGPTPAPLESALGDEFGSFVRGVLAGAGLAPDPRSVPEARSVPIEPAILGRPHRILAVELPGRAGDSAPAAALLGELGRGDPSVLAVAGFDGRVFIAVANGGRPSLEETFARVSEYAERYLGATAVGAYSSAVLIPGGASAALRSALDSVSRWTFGPGRTLVFPEDVQEPGPSGSFKSEAYAASCLELSRSVEAYDAERCAAAISAVASSLSVPEDARRLRSLFLDSLVPFRLRARALGFDPDRIPGVGTVSDLVDLAWTVQEAAERAASYARLFVPYALERSGDRREIAAVRCWVLSDLRRQFSVEEAAAVASLSPSHFAHVFKETVGQSFIDWVNRSRMERARELLLTTDLLVKEVSEAVGIENPAWFGVLFKRLMGVAPNEVREGRGSSCP